MVLIGFATKVGFCQKTECQSDGNVLQMQEVQVHGFVHMTEQMNHKGKGDQRRQKRGKSEEHQ